MIVAGMSPLTATLTIALLEFLLGKTITGTVQGGVVAPIDTPRCVDMYMAGQLPLDKLITRTYTLDQIDEALEAMENGDAIRSVIKM